MPIIPELMANRWKKAHRGHYRIYPFFNKLLYPVIFMSTKKIFQRNMSAQKPVKVITILFRMFLMNP